jgi:hypothetical protein
LAMARGSAVLAIKDGCTAGDIRRLKGRLRRRQALM